MPTVKSDCRSFTGLTLTVAALLAAPASASALDHERPMAIFGEAHGTMIYQDSDRETNSDYFTSLRLQLDVRPIPDFSFTARLNALKSFDSDQADDDDYMIDRFYLDWNRVAGWPVRLRGGRLPTLGENSPTHLRLGLDSPAGTFSPFTDLVLDGASLDVSRPEGTWLTTSAFYAAGQSDAGYESGENPFGLDDTEIYGVGLEIYRNRTASATLMGLAFRNIYNLPEGASFVNPLEYASWEASANPTGNMILDRANLGNIYHLSAQWTDRVGSLHYFFSWAWSRTDARGMDELGTGLLSSWWEQPTNKNGYAVYGGLRYDLATLPIKLGFEYNYGSRNWIGMADKLNTRGSVVEFYTTYTMVPRAGLHRSIFRLGCQYYDYEYSGSGYWLGKPMKVSDLQNEPLAMSFSNQPTHEFKVYGALDLHF